MASGTPDPNFSFYLISVHLDFSRHTWLVAAVLGSEHRPRSLFLSLFQLTFYCGKIANKHRKERLV